MFHRRQLPSRRDRSHILPDEDQEDISDSIRNTRAAMTVATASRKHSDPSTFERGNEASDDDGAERYEEVEETCVHLTGKEPLEYASFQTIRTA